MGPTWGPPGSCRPLMGHVGPMTLAIRVIVHWLVSLCLCAILFDHDDVIKWKHFPLYWPFVRGIHRWPVNSPHKGQWRRALMFSLICALNKRWSKQSWGWWFETPSRPLWRHCNMLRMPHYLFVCQVAVPRWASLQGIYAPRMLCTHLIPALTMVASFHANGSSRQAENLLHSQRYQELQMSLIQQPERMTNMRSVKLIFIFLFQGFWATYSSLSKSATVLTHGGWVTHICVIELSSLDWHWFR